jgi:hypothetical protein
VCVVFFGSFLLPVDRCWHVSKKKKIQFQTSIGRIYRSFIDQLLFEEKKIVERDVNRIEGEAIYSIMHAIAALMRLRYFSCEGST